MMVEISRVECAQTNDDLTDNTKNLTFTLCNGEAPEYFIAGSTRIFLDFPIHSAFGWGTYFQNILQCTFIVGHHKGFVRNGNTQCFKFFFKVIKRFAILKFIGPSF